MANPITCPSCKNTFSPSEASADGPFQCPHCGDLVGAPGSSVRQPVASSTNAPKGAGARPELLDRLPPSPVTSPGVIAGASAFVLAYGVVMLIVLAGTRRDDTGTFEEPDPLEIAVATRKHSVPGPPPPIADPKAKEADPKAKEAAPNSEEATPKVEAPAPKPEEAPPGPPPETVIAKVTVPKPTPKPKPAEPKPIRTIANLGKLIDAVGDCKLMRDADGLTIALPGKLHVLSPELGIANSPMALISVEGDFVAQVKVAGEVMPGRTPVEKMPFAFHGAGLLLWKDKDNYVRLERAGAGASGHPHTHQILVEVCKDGKPSGHNYADWPAGPTLLRMERRQDGLICLHSGDGQTWFEDKVLGPLFPGKVSVGISASNTSKKAFPARFEAFTLAEGSAETAESTPP